MDRLKDKVTLITGGGSGIGKVSGQLFAREGSKIVVLEINPALGEAAAADVKKQGGDAFFVQADVTNEASVNAAVEKAIGKYSRIDVLFNCAGGSARDDAPVTEVDLALFNQTMNLDVLGTMLASRHVIPSMIANNSGSVINVATWGAFRGANPKHVYTAAKGAIVSLTRAMAGEYAKNGIRVNAIAPGVVRTERSIRNHENPGTRVAVDRPSKEVREYMKATYPFSIGEPIDIANIALFLASSESRMVTAATIMADGGRSAY
ncbi:MAG: SDR family oxidoreductase [Pseudolabrys sp.]